MPELVYLDNAATTKMLPEVLDAMMPYLTDKYGNPSSIHSFGASCNAACDEARKKVASVINAKENEIYFTAGGTESDNWALKSVAYMKKSKGKHIITSAIEHHAIFETCEFLARDGFEITFVGVDDKGIIKMDELKAAIRQDTILISVMYANNEIGTIQPIREIGALARSKGILFHTDAVQAYGHIPIDVEADNIDLLSASAHKLHGPKGVGMLYMKNNIKLTPFIHGGAQERNRRAGTMNVPGIVGFGKAAEIAKKNMAANGAKLKEMNYYLMDKILKEIPFSKLNGDRDKRLPGSVNISFRFIEGESMLMMVDMKGVAASTGSACASGSLDPSHVLLAIGLPHEIAHGSIRLTMSEDTTKKDLDYTVGVLKEVVSKLRAMSPLYEDAVRRKEA
ncbi:cysteine desulfurase IscS 2 [Candidatus Methanoplasma termitum]|uniref:Cysteine desulfurase IscS n=1 Tax=Candidatus Methanoplasma termitum TaxID=1577791 RepID=A0A0A7LDU0_9ARCH|nr:cysteine desulfurase NifS [Candidatus Methanoplasma termitum]AIZ56482.1 cysteine desulfurase IscS 2 [Candidatus Methanoplasma termitum]